MENKENVEFSELLQSSHVGTPLPLKSTVKKVGNGTPLTLSNRGSRTPLQDVNSQDRLISQVNTCSVSKAAKLIQYGQLIPISLPSGNAKSKEMLHQKMTLSPSFDQAVEPSVLSSHRLPSVQYKKMMGAFHNYKQDYEEQLDHKDKYIKSLEEKLTCNSNIAVYSVGESEKQNSSTKMNEGLADTGDVEVHSMEIKTFAENDTCTPTVGTSPHRTPIPLRRISFSKLENDQLPICSSGSPFLAFVNQESIVEGGKKSVGCSPIKVTEDQESRTFKAKLKSPNPKQQRRASLPRYTTTYDEFTYNADIIHRRASLQFGYGKTYPAVKVFVTSPDNSTREIENSPMDKITKDNVKSSSNSHDLKGAELNSKCKMDATESQVKVVMNNECNPESMDEVKFTVYQDCTNNNSCEVDSSAVHFDNNDAASSVDHSCNTQKSGIWVHEDIGIGANETEQDIPADICDLPSVYDRVCSDEKCFVDSCMNTISDVSKNTAIGETNDIAMNTIIVDFNDTAMNTDIVESSDTAMNAVAETNDTAMNTVLIESNDTEMNTFAVESNDTAMNTIAVESNDRAMNTIVVASNDTAMNTISVKSNDTAVNTIAIESNDYDTVMNTIAESNPSTMNMVVAVNPKVIESISMSVNTSMIELNETAMNTSITETKEAALNTSHVVLYDTGMNTSSVPVQEACVNTEQLVLADKSINTSCSELCEKMEVGIGTEKADGIDCGINTCLSGPVNSRRESTEAETCITPKKSKSVAISTSPTCLYVARPSEVGTVNFSEKDLKFQLESATISNTLLRNELKEAQSSEEQTRLNYEQVSSLVSELREQMKTASNKATASLQEQVEDLMTQQSADLNQISSLEAQLTLEKSKNADIEKKYEQQIALLRNQVVELQTDLKLAYKAKQQEIKLLEEKYAVEDYKSLYQKSQSRLSDSQEKLQHFTRTFTLLQESQQTQIEAQKVLEKGLIKVKEVADKNVKERKELEEKVSQWNEEKLELEKEYEVKHTEYEKMNLEYKSILEKLDTKDKEITELNTNLTETQEKVFAAEKAVKDISTVNQSLIQGLDEQMIKIKDLQNENEQCKHDIQQKTGHMQSMQDICEEMSLELVKIKEEYSNNRTEKTKLAEELNSLTERNKSEILSLKQTNENQEEKIVRLSKSVTSLQDVCSKQKSIISTLEQDLKEYKEKGRQLIALQDQYQRMQQSSKENEEFVEQERCILREEVEENKKKRAAFEAIHESVVKEKEELSELLELARENLSHKIAELDHVKTEAHMMILQQGSEISSGLGSLEKLSGRVDTVFKELKRRSVQLDKYQQQGDLEKSLSTSVLTIDNNLTDGEKMAVGKSFLTSVLTAMNSEDTQLSAIPEELPQDCTEVSVNRFEVQSPPMENKDAKKFGEKQLSPISTVSRIRYSSGGSAFSAYSKVNPPVKGNLKDSMESPVNQTQDDGNESRAACDNDSQVMEELTLSEQAENLYTVVGEMIVIIKVLDKAFAENEARLQDKIVELEKRAELSSLDSVRSRKGQEDKNKSLELRLNECHKKERQLKSDLAELKQCCTNKDRDLATVRQMLEDKTRALDSALEQNSSDKNLQDKCQKLQRSIVAKETEYQLLKQSFDNLLEEIDNSGENSNHSAAAAKRYSASNCESKYIKENYLLKMEVNKLRQKLVFTKEEMEELANKANSRQKKYQLSLNKAEEEIRTLDNTIDKLRYLLRKHKEIVKTWSDARDVWMEIVYDKRLDDKSMQWDS